jgi:aerobic-type carbon monoxide dehydrogenase small subunit (CoxS/CutS family)
MAMGNKLNEGDVYETEVVNLTVNGKVFRLEVGGNPHQVKPTHTLLHTIRETIGLKGTKKACDQGACGACTIIADGEPALSCMMLTIECDGKNIVTIEGLEDPLTGELDNLQEAFAKYSAFQCGFCTPGMIMTSKALLENKTDPTENEIKAALSGNFCRCISHYQVMDAVKEAAKNRR